MDEIRQTVHVSPTRTSFLYLLICLAVWLASANYMNNLAYIFFFLMVSLYAGGYFRSRLLLKWLTVSEMILEQAFAGGKTRVEMMIQNRSAQDLEAVFIIPEGEATIETCIGPIQVPGNGSLLHDFSIPAPRRGLFRLRSLRILTQEPLGLFKSRILIPVDMEYIVFPRPGGRKSWNEPRLNEAEPVEGYHTSGGEDFSGSRAYRLGESQRHIDWKAYARGRPLSVKEFSGGGSLTLWFDWDQLADLDGEARLSQLTRWILGADRTGQEFGLRLPNGSIEPDSGSLHTQQCLRMLAVFPGET